MPAKTDYYDGLVCYMGGWHYTIIPHPNGEGYEDENGNFVVYEVPGEKLVCEDTAGGEKTRFRLATDKDEKSWHDRKHGNFTTLQFEDAVNPITVSNEEGAALLEYLRKLRSEGNE